LFNRQHSRFQIPDSGESFLPIFPGLEGRAKSIVALRRKTQAGRLGVSGVPAFVANRKAALSGVQPVKNLRKSIQSVRAEPEDHV